MSDGEKKYWYNSNSGLVEFGFTSPSAERVGPFDTEEEAARAPETLRARADAWAAEEAREDNWPAATESDGK